MPEFEVNGNRFAVLSAVSGIQVAAPHLHDRES